MIHFRSAVECVHVQLATTPLASLIADADAGDAIVVELVEVTHALGRHRDARGLSFSQEVHVALAAARNGLRSGAQAPGV